MTDSELQLILQEGEGYTIEFKENANSDLSRELVAFANASGGRIFIGINDRGSITGIKSTNALRSQIQEFATACDPAVTIQIETFQNTIIVHVPQVRTNPTAAQKASISAMEPTPRNSPPERLRSSCRPKAKPASTKYSATMSMQRP